TVEGASYSIRYGRLDGKGVKTDTKKLGSADEARQLAEKVIAQKLGDGYSQVANEGFSLVGSNATARATAQAVVQEKPKGAVKAREAVTGKKLALAGQAISDSVASAFMAAAAQKKLPVGEIAKLVEAFDKGRLAPDQAAPAFAALTALF